MSSLRDEDFAQVALRSQALQATWNYERQQGLGWAWALEPALTRLYADPRERCDRLAEHTAYFNTQPTLASLALGAVARLEEQRALGNGPDAESMRRIKSVLGAALAALGDRLFWFSLRPMAACLGVLLAAGGSHLGAAAFWVCYNAVHQTLRWRGVSWGYRDGPAVLGGALRDRLEAMTSLVNVAGCAVLGVLLAVLLAPGGRPQPLGFQVLLTLGIGFGFLTALRARPSPTAWAIGIGAVTLIMSWLR